MNYYQYKRNYFLREQCSRDWQLRRVQREEELHREIRTIRNRGETLEKLKIQNQVRVKELEKVMKGLTVEKKEEFRSKVSKGLTVEKEEFRSTVAKGLTMEKKEEFRSKVRKGLTVEKREEFQSKVAKGLTLEKEEFRSKVAKGLTVKKKEEFRSKLKATQTHVSGEHTEVTKMLDFSFSSKQRKAVKKTSKKKRVQNGRSQSTQFLPFVKFVPKRKPSPYSEKLEHGSLAGVSGKKVKMFSTQAKARGIAKGRPNNKQNGRKGSESIGKKEQKEMERGGNRIGKTVTSKKGKTRPNHGKTNLTKLNVVQEQKGNLKQNAKCHHDTVSQQLRLHYQNLLLAVDKDVKPYAPASAWKRSKLHQKRVLHKLLQPMETKLPLLTPREALECRYLRLPRKQVKDLESQCDLDLIDLHSHMTSEELNTWISQMK